MRKSTFEQPPHFTSSWGVFVPAPHASSPHTQPGTVAVSWLSTSAGRGSQGHLRANQHGLGGPHQKGIDNGSFRANFMRSRFLLCTEAHLCRCWGPLPVRTCPQIQVAHKRGESSPRRHTLLLRLYGAPSPTSIAPSLSKSEGKSDLENWNVVKWESNPSTAGDLADPWKWRLRRLRRTGWGEKSLN